MAMTLNKLHVWSIMHRVVSFHYIVDYQGDLEAFSVGNALWVIREGQDKYHWTGKMFMLFTDRAAFLVSKVGEEWKVFEHSVSFQPMPVPDTVQDNLSGN